jgi:hypothetical protein
MIAEMIAIVQRDMKAEFAGLRAELARIDRDHAEALRPRRPSA